MRKSQGTYASEDALSLLENMTELDKLIVVILEVSFIAAELANITLNSADLCLQLVHEIRLIARGHRRDGVNGARYKLRLDNLVTEITYAACQSKNIKVITAVRRMRSRSSQRRTSLT